MINGNIQEEYVNRRAYGYGYQLRSEQIYENAPEIAIEIPIGADSFIIESEILDGIWNFYLDLLNPIHVITAEKDYILNFYDFDRNLQIGENFNSQGYKSGDVLNGYLIGQVPNAKKFRLIFENNSKITLYVIEQESSKQHLVMWAFTEEVITSPILGIAISQQELLDGGESYKIKTKLYTK